MPFCLLPFLPTGEGGRMPDEGLFHQDPMLRFLTIRILSAFPVLFVMSIITYGIIQAPPGDYADYVENMLLFQNASQEVAQKAAEQFRIDNGLNDPFIVQYFRWIKGFFVGDFGHSYFYNRPVSEVVWQRLPATLGIALTCHILATFFGIGFGIWAASRQYGLSDIILSTFAFLGTTIPRFLMALIILYILAFKLNVQELGSFYSTKYGGQPMSWAKFMDLLAHIWPVIAVATIGGLAYNMRVMRGNLLDTLNAQYVETARAKGLSNSATIFKHAVPNALHPLVAYQGTVLPYMLTGEIEVAIIFALPTIGPAIVGSMGRGDVMVTATLMLILGATLIIGNIIADMLLAWLDPRVRLGTD
jgi:peptide/nickel transport system permease protein